MASLLFGQRSDPNIEVLVPYFDIFVDQASVIHWDLDQDALFVDGVSCIFDSYFGRANVFETNTHVKYNNFYIMRNYVESHVDIARYNSDYHGEVPFKLHNLMVARRVGLKVPYTEAGLGTQREDSILKPVTGGAHVVRGSRSLVPMIVQDRVIGLNKRLFIIGDDAFCFGLRSDYLDYRDDPEPSLFISEISDAIVEKTRRVMLELGLTFGAADFIDETFLEINTMPMFVAFDQVVDGAIARSICGQLGNL